MPKNLKNDNSPAFGRREGFLKEENSPNQLFVKTSKSVNVSPTQLNKIMKPNAIIEEVQELEISSEDSDMKSNSSLSRESD